MDIVFDTETTGVPLWKEPSEDPKQPHLVQIAAELLERKTGSVINTMNVVVKPDGWIIPEETIAIHGITNEYAHEHGIPERQAIEQFLALVAKAERRVAHNTTFDDRMVRIALKRYFDVEGAMEDKQPSELWKTATEKFCTMWTGKKYYGFGKTPTLEELYIKAVGKEWPAKEAHHADADTRFCREIYIEMVKLGIA